MYYYFQQCFQDYLGLYRAEFASNDHLLTLIAPFYGLTNRAYYNQWKMDSDLRYYEASHLIWRMRQEDMPAELQDLGDSLLENGYEEVRNMQSFSEATVKEQMKLIYTMLTKNPQTRPDLFPKPVPVQQPGYIGQSTAPRLSLDTMPVPTELIRRMEERKEAVAKAPAEEDGIKISPPRKPAFEDDDEEIELFQ